MHRHLTLCILCLILGIKATAQVLETDDGNRFQWGRDSTHTQKTPLPMGVFQWTLSPTLGEVQLCEDVDTLMQGFQVSNNHDGPRGTYNHTGVHGAPRLSRLYFERPSVNSPLFFIDSYDYFRPDIATFRFSNTKCPITNLSYHRAGSSSQGNDRVRATFATNVNRISGLGFNLDYLYARGAYNLQQNSMFNGTVFGYYQGERYQMHAWASMNHSKMAENGGIVDDDYILHPERFERSFNSRDIPTQVANMWNRNDDQTYYLTHRYNLGYYRRIELPDSLLPHIPSDDELLQDAFKDSLVQAIRADSARLQLTLDTLRLKAEAALVYPEEFIPVASIIHTMRTQRMDHALSGRRMNGNADYFALPAGSVLTDGLNDHSLATQVSNTLALSLREGFRPWVKAGLTAFATHDHTRYTLPDSVEYRENDLSLGGTFARTGGQALHFDATGRVTVIGQHVGDFNLDGVIKTRFRIARDTCMLRAHAVLRGDKPNFFYRHYHSSLATWDIGNLSQEMRTRVEGTLGLQRLGTSLSVGMENVTNYTYLHTTLTPNPGNYTNPYRHNVQPLQASGSIQILAATLRQDFKWGIFRWENQLTWQKSSRQSVLPLPDLDFNTNMYLHFRVARVLNIDLGADARYFTRYAAPDYSVAMNTFATQDSDHKVMIGGYPIVDVYVNAHLKHFRVYFCAQHINATFMQGNSFLVPHYPVDPMMLHFGLSWNFFN